MWGYIIVIVLCTIVLFKIVRDVVNGVSSRGWSTAAGKILHSGIQSRQSTDSDGYTSTTFGAAVQYSYNVGGQDFQGTRRTFSDVRTNSVRRAEEIVARYPQGSPVMVYHHPEKPSLCVLEPGVSWLTYIGLILVFGLLIFGILGVFGLVG